MNQENEKTPLEMQLNELLLDCTKEELAKKEENILDRRMGEMSTEDLLNLTMQIQQYLNEPKIGMTDENNYQRFATVYGAACMQIEKRDEAEMNHE